MSTHNNQRPLCQDCGRRAVSGHRYPFCRNCAAKYRCQVCGTVSRANVRNRYCGGCAKSRSHCNRLLQEDRVHRAAFATVIDARIAIYGQRAALGLPLFDR